MRAPDASTLPPMLPAEAKLKRHCSNVPSNKPVGAGWRRIAGARYQDPIFTRVDAWPSSRHRVDGNWRAFERLQAGGAVGVAEGLRAELAGAAAGPLADATALELIGG
jgi:hypothetical protein